MDNAYTFRLQTVFSLFLPYLIFFYLILSWFYLNEVINDTPYIIEQAYIIGLYEFSISLNY